MIEYKVKDTALDATAIAIQSLTSESAQIKWDDTTGYANNIAAIPTSDDILATFIEGPIKGVFENSKITKIREYAFYNCTKLTTARFPACTSIGSNVFYSCYNLTTTSFPTCTTIESYAFASCVSLTTASFPTCMTIGSYAFANCYELTTVILNASQTVSSIYSNAFSRCFNLTSLYLLASTMYKLPNKNVFINTPISTNTTSTGGVYGSIFVRESLYASYIAATNWATYSNRFVGLTDEQITALEKNEGYDNAIGFHIDDTYCIAEEGMTWAEWCESDYNTVSARIEYGYVWYQSSSMLDDAHANDAIKANNFYTSAAAGGMGS